MYYVEVTMRIDLATARDVAEHALEVRGFDVRWRSETYADAERGSARAYSLFGMFAQHFKIGVNVYPAGEDGLSVIRLQRLVDGWYGGLVSAARVNAQFRRLRDALVAAARQENVLVRVIDG